MKRSREYISETESVKDEAFDKFNQQKQQYAEQLLSRELNCIEELQFDDFFMI